MSLRKYMIMSELNSNIRINAILKDNDSLRISLAVNPRTTIAKLKRVIEQEIHELHGVTILVRLVEDSQGFVLSNNSTIGEHLRHNDTIYVQSHKDKTGSNMNLPSNLPDLFLTLRYVSSSVTKRLLEAESELDPLEVVPQIVHLGFWYSNIETVSNLCRILNKIFTTDNIDRYHQLAHHMQNSLLLQLLSFWLVQIKDVFTSFPETAEELLALLYKLSIHAYYAELLKTHKITKTMFEMSKDSNIRPELKRIVVKMLRNVSGKGGISKSPQSAYIPTAFGQSNTQFDFTNIDDVLNNLTGNTQEGKASALQQLVEKPKLISEATVRFDYYLKLTSIFTIRTIKDKTSARIFSQVVRGLITNTTKEKACEVMQKDIIKRIHGFLLDSHTDAHPAVLDYYNLIGKESASKGVFNIEQASQILSSPYLSFQRTTAQALAQMSERKTSPIRFLPSIKDYIRIALKTDDQTLSTALLKTISSLTLDEQCRYQIVNLKGIEVFVKFLEVGQRSQNGQLQRVCGKGLLNLSLGSRQAKGRVVGQLGDILERCYRGSIDTIAASYIENILKTPKH